MQFPKFENSNHIPSTSLLTTDATLPPYVPERQLSYKGALTLVDSSCMAVEQLAKSKDKNDYIVACHFDSIQHEL
jgi:hypothetical protein